MSLVKSWRKGATSNIWNYKYRLKQRITPNRELKLTDIGFMAIKPYNQ